MTAVFRLLTMGIMKPALFITAAVATGALSAILAIAAVAQDEDTALLNFLVIKDYNGKPIRNASVVMHPVEKNGKQSRGGLQIKTDPDGKARFDGVPYGKLRVQVLAEGFQTFGEDYDINTPNMDITIKMKRPSEQYSIYDNQKKDKQNKDESQPQNPPPQ
jgi:Carboxypeptidase regulatory-like domain